MQNLFQMGNCVRTSTAAGDEPSALDHVSCQECPQVREADTTQSMKNKLLLALDPSTSVKHIRIYNQFVFEFHCVSFCYYTHVFVCFQICAFFFA